MDIDKYEDSTESTDNRRAALISLPSFDDNDSTASLERISDVTIATAADLGGVSDPDATAVITKEQLSEASASSQSYSADETAPLDVAGHATEPDGSPDSMAPIDSEATTELPAIPDPAVSSFSDPAATIATEPASSYVAEPSSFSSEPSVSYDSEPASTFSAGPVNQGFETYGTGLAAEAQKKNMGTAKRVLIVLGSILLTALIIFVVGGLYFSTHFLPNTTVNGEDVSGMSIQDLSDHVTSIGQNYVVHVAGDGINLSITGPEIDYNCDGESYGAEAQAQINSWQWPAELGKTHEYTATQSTSYDQKKLESLVDAHINAVNAKASQPTNATMRYDEESKKYVVVDQAYGTAVERDAIIDTVSKGVQTLQEEVELGDAELVQPTVWKDDEKLTTNVATANNLLTSNIVLRIANNDAISLDPNRIATWLSMNAETSLDVNRDLVKEWTQGELSEQFDTVGTTRTYTRPDGKEIEVSGGTYGWVLDGEALANIIADNLMAGKADPIEVPMKMEAAAWAPGGKEWPNRYIDVDLSEQYVRMYDDDSNVIWESSCVSGKPMYGGGTSTGVDYIYEKDSPMILVGNDYDFDGQPDYKTPVDYWMPFDGGQGLHDASWRYYFGGDIYAYDGSHGCVNLPYGAAQELYGITNVGDVVIVHW